MMKPTKRPTRRKRESLPCFEGNIIGGTYKGKKILIPNLSTTRSSKAILRESLFNTLQFDIIDKGFVEVFAGSGSIGLEAWSRGADKLFFIEKNRSVYTLLKENLQRLNASDATAIHGDSFEVFSDIYTHIQDQKLKSYFYFDPPFSTREGMEDIYEKTLVLIGMIEPEVCETVIIEHMSTLKMPESIKELTRKKVKKFGKSSLSYYSHS